MAYRLKWGGSDGERKDACGISELTATVGLFYIFLICLGLLFVILKNQQGRHAPPPAPSPQLALYKALLPFDSGL